MKKLWLLAAAVVVTLLVACAPVSQSLDEPIRVLYVGQNPDTVEGYSYGGNRADNAKLIKTKAAEYMAFLNQHFDATLVYGEAYKPEMSANYDVTVFDALPMELDGKDMTDSERYGYASPHAGWRWLPNDFNHATIFVAGPLTNMGPSLSLTMGTLCNCLDKTAFKFDESHPIFSSPNKVPLDYVETPYAGGVFNYYSGRNLPKKIPMLRMEVDDPQGLSLPPGLVTVPGTGDSPDTEYISGGTCIKSVNAVAIARHGNFLQWGFRSSPVHMTEAAKLAFINAVHYIKPFKGAKRLVAKKSAHRLAAMDAPYKLSDQGWAVQLENHNKANAVLQGQYDRVQAGTGSEQDKMMVKLLGKPKALDRSRFVKSIPKSLQQEFGEDWNRYLAYYEANMGYLYASEGYQFAFDADAQQLGIANNNPAILDRSIALLEQGDQVELAQRVLARYTTQQFETPQQWRQWFDSNQDKLFFTEVGGYKFMVNTL
ncbi:hypothetical protein QSV34_06310 [Porticoccus sp. W117]|uniref:hypothetical protein n=1 Tax=Porticoccus sp. W117 TaxID=3054777 RepID=UPI002599F6EA|nr:hypothetical protein [Porticoccus sp. W117]MDM3870966.1 hypothetical protein [Porticoccus sp. W117]